MKELGVTESYKLKRQVVVSASEASEMILRGMHRHPEGQGKHADLLNNPFSRRHLTVCAKET